MGPVSFETGQVQIIFPDGRIRLLPYRSCLDPLLVYGRVFILTTKDGLLTGIVVYHLEKGHSQAYPLPKYLHPYFSCPSFSPDGTKLAHYEVTKPRYGRVLVRSWPAGKILKQSPIYRLVPTDVPPFEPTWKTPLRVEFDPDFFEPSRAIFFQFEKK
jgi:hypothetical protein